MSGRPPTITSSGKHTEYEKRWNKWTRPLRRATEEINKKLLMKAFEVALKLVMKNHVYTFNKECFKQLKGGTIGVSIAGDVANLFVVWWDRELKIRLEHEGIILKLYSRYVDDGNIVIKSEPNLNEYNNKQKEKKIMEKVKDVANSIHKSISVKIDYPSNHGNQRLPILDTEMWIVEVDVGGTKKHQIIYSYYEKEMSSKYLIHKKSALSNQSKRNTLINDLVRVMKNTSLKVGDDESQSNIQHFMNKMQFSGYEKDKRIKVCQKAKRSFDENLRTSEIYPHKDKFLRINEQTRRKIYQKKLWYARGKYKSVFYVDATTNSYLVRQCQQVLNQYEVPIKVMEKTGSSIQELLVKSKPFKDKRCNDPKCNVCLSGCKINCRAET